jgi:hypothetical protein
MLSDCNGNKFLFVIYKESFSCRFYKIKFQVEMNVKDLIGTFTIVGSNQDAEENSYKGTLTLAIDTNNRIIAKWLINNEQEQIGTGF